MKYIAEIESKVAGIPCMIGVVHYVTVAGNSQADNEQDYYGYSESQWDVCDRSGRRAPWLEIKLTAADKARIESEIDNDFN